MYENESFTVLLKLIKELPIMTTIRLTILQRKPIFAEQNLIGIIPKISWDEFFNKVKTEEYRGEEELKEIRSKFPQEILDNDIKSGVATW